MHKIKNIKRIVELTNPISGKPIKNSSVTDLNLMLQVLENYFPDVKTDDLYYSLPNVNKIDLKNYLK
tara:strand:+ start:13 stop:213 length:201 start_codon:yes stop_codon:yes gene_type:complete